MFHCYKAKSGNDKEFVQVCMTYVRPFVGGIEI